MIFRNQRVLAGHCRTVIIFVGELGLEVFKVICSCFGLVATGYNNIICV